MSPAYDRGGVLPSPGFMPEFRGPLAAAQEARVAALEVARRVLDTSTTVGPANASKPPESFDLIEVAEWIVNGREPSGDPFADHLATAAPADVNSGDEEDPS